MSTQPSGTYYIASGKNIFISITTIEVNRNSSLNFFKHRRNIGFIVWQVLIE